MNRHLIDENHCLKKDFHNAEHCLKNLIANKKDIQHQIRLESKATNNLIQSNQDEAEGTMERARNILSKANQSKKEAERLKDEIETSHNNFLACR